MSQYSQMLDEAMSIARKELDFLIAGEVFEAEKLAYSREQILETILNGLSKNDLVELADTLEELKALHDQVTGEAQRLKKSLKQDLTSIKKQNRRISGYSIGSGNIPRLAKERFISKKS